MWRAYTHFTQVWRHAHPAHRCVNAGTWSSPISGKERRRTPNCLFFQAPDSCWEKLQCKWARMSCGRQSSGPLRHPPTGAGIHGHHRPPGVNGSQRSHKLNGRLMRWALVLQAYQYAIMYHPGIHHQNADGLTRQSWPEDDDSLLRETGTPSTTSKNEECRGH